MVGYYEQAGEVAMANLCRQALAAQYDRAWDEQQRQQGVRFLNNPVTKALNSLGDAAHALANEQLRAEYQALRTMPIQEAHVRSLRFMPAESPFAPMNPDLVVNRGPEDFMASTAVTTALAGVTMLGGEGLAAMRSAFATPLEGPGSLASLEPMTSLYRGVMPPEFASINATGRFVNLGYAEGKYFSTTAEGVSSFSKQAFPSWRQPFTMFETEIPTRILQPEWYPPTTFVDRNVPGVLIPNRYLPYLEPQYVPTMPVP